MILPNNFDTTPYVLGNLTKKQRSFVEFLYEAGHTNADEVVFKRNYLKNVANAWGSEWAPAWVVKDISRVTTRGFYAIPELTALIEEMSPAEDTTDEDVATATDESLEVSDDMVGDALRVSDDMTVHVSAS